MKAQIFLCLIWTLTVVSGENVLTMENISAQGLRFTDLVEKIKQDNLNISPKCSEHLRVLLYNHSEALGQSKLFLQQYFSYQYA